MNDLIKRLRKPGDEVFSTRLKAQIAGELDRCDTQKAALVAEVDRLTRELADEHRNHLDAENTYRKEIDRMEIDCASREAQIAELKGHIDALITWGHGKSAVKAAVEAIATKAPDEYLKAWLGEPVAWMFEDGSAVLEDDLKYVADKSGQRVTPLYAPKGLEK